MDLDKLDRVSADFDDFNLFKEFINFLGIARGSLSELETQLTIAGRLGFMDGAVDISERVNKVFALLNGLIRSLKKRKKQDAK